MRRRDLLQGLGAASTLALAGWPFRARSSNGAAPRVVIAGGGFAGSTCARYLRRIDPGLDVTLVEPHATYTACPFSNLVIVGLRDAQSLEMRYDDLSSHGVHVIHDTITGIDPTARLARLAGGENLRFDRMVVAPGIALRWGTPEGYDEAAAERMPHAYQPGAQTMLLARQLAAMDDGGVVAIAVPAAPFRCPPGPYERAGLIANFLKQHKPRSTVLILDANDKFTKQDLFLEGWKTLYGDMVKWVPLSEDGKVVAVDPGTLTLRTEFGSHRVAVANVIPAQSAADLALKAGLADASMWCPVAPRSFESTLVPGIYVLGDAAIAHPMPKSASAANSQAKVCALQVVAALRGDPPIQPLYHNTCYSLVGPDYGISVNGMYDVRDDKLVAIEGSGGVSPLGALPEVRHKEAEFTSAWFHSITTDSFG